MTKYWQYTQLREKSHKAASWCDANIVKEMCVHTNAFKQPYIAAQEKKKKTEIVTKMCNVPISWR